MDGTRQELDRERPKRYRGALAGRVRPRLRRERRAGRLDTARRRLAAWNKRSAETVGFRRGSLALHHGGTEAVFLSSSPCLSVSVVGVAFTSPAELVSP